MQEHAHSQAAMWIAAMCGGNTHCKLHFRYWSNPFVSHFPDTLASLIIWKNYTFSQSFTCSPDSAVLPYPFGILILPTIPFGSTPNICAWVWGLGGYALCRGQCKPPPTTGRGGRYWGGGVTRGFPLHLHLRGVWTFGEPNWQIPSPNTSHLTWGFIRGLQASTETFSVTCPLSKFPIVFTCPRRKSTCPAVSKKKAKNWTLEWKSDNGSYTRGGGWHGNAEGEENVGMFYIILLSFLILFLQNQGREWWRKKLSETTTPRLLDRGITLSGRVFRALGRPWRPSIPRLSKLNSSPFLGAFLPTFKGLVLYSESKKHKPAVYNSYFKWLHHQS